jgi:hypothetical protein
LYQWGAVTAIALGFAIVAISYWPGIMIDDARWQYQQSVDNSYEDWHPPLMAWIWRRLMFVQRGPGPMLLLQLALFWGGIALMIYWANKRGRPRLGLALALAGWIPAPFALSGTVTKDFLMAGALSSAAGLLLAKEAVHERWVRIALSAISVALIFFAAALRLNAVVACVPLLLAALPSRLSSTKPRIAVAGVMAVVLLLAIGPAINAALEAEHTDVDLSLIIFDLGGITEHSGVDAFPDLGVRNPVAVNHRCYDPTQWDSYSTWAQTPCPLGFERFQNAKDDDGFDPVTVWLTAIARHPLAYAEHRLEHFNIAAAFLVASGPDFTAWSQSVDNPWGYKVRPNAVIAAVTRVTDAVARTPVGWPIFWMSIALAALVVGLILGAQPVPIALATSSFLYGFSYIVLSVAVGMRYYVWTIIGAALAAILIAEQLASREAKPARRAMCIGAAIVAVPTALAVLARAIG